MFRAQGRIQEANDDRSCFVLTDLNGKIVMASSAWYRTWQCTPAQAIGHSTSILNGDGYDSRACSMVKRAVTDLVTDRNAVRTPPLRVVNSRRGCSRSGTSPADATYSHTLMVEKLFIEGDVYGDKSHDAGEWCTTWLLVVSTQLEVHAGRAPA